MPRHLQDLKFNKIDRRKLHKKGFDLFNLMMCKDEKDGNSDERYELFKHMFVVIEIVRQAKKRMGHLLVIFAHFINYNRIDQ